MSLDIPTLIVALMAGYLLLALQLLGSLRGALRSPGLRQWSWGSWCFLVGFGSLAARGVIPMALSVVLGNACVMLGILVYCDALQQFVKQRRLPAVYWMIWGATVLATIGMLELAAAQRTAFLSLVNAATLLPTSLVVLQHSRHGETSLRAVGATLLLAALAMMLRSVHAWSDPAQYNDLFRSSLGQGLTFLFAFLGLLGAGFGFVLANFERAARRMEELATYDQLTGCMNRSSADALLEHELRRGRRQGAPVAFAMLDIDHFKHINDRFGHQAGDRALVAFASAVRSRLRGSDVLSRLGGEEFGLILPATDTPGANHLLTAIREHVAQLRLQSSAEETFGLTVSIGLVIVPSDAAISAEQVYALADRALYRAKGLGRDRIELEEANVVGKDG